MTVGAIFYAKQGHTYILKFVGDIRYTMSCSLDRFLERLFERDDFDTIAIDLTETTAIDSTNLGLLAKIANFARRRFNCKPPLHTTNRDVNQVLDSMGFDDVFELCYEPSCADCPKGVRRLEVDEPGRDEMARTMLDAHCLLSDLNEQNRIEFKNIVGALQQRQTAGSTS